MPNKTIRTNNLKAPFLFTLLCLSTPLWAQIDVQFDVNGEYQTVIEVKDSSINLYGKTKEWIVSNYINPKEVIVADKPNEYLKISAMQSESTTNGIGNPGFYYTVNFECKEGRYRITYNITKLFTTGQYANSWPYSNYYNGKGELRKMNEGKVSRLQKIASGLLEEHLKFLNEDKKSKNDDW